MTRYPVLAAKNAANTGLCHAALSGQFFNPASLIQTSVLNPGSFRPGSSGEAASNRLPVFNHSHSEIDNHLLDCFEII
jgi:hypothetical protein